VWLCLNSLMSLALYIHFPFCVRKCSYCDFNSVAGAGSDHREYVSAVVREMELRRATLPEPAEAATLFLGGGTPSLMEPQSAASLIDAARRWYGLRDDAEVTLEANPGTVDRHRLEEFRTAGVSRLSLGIQSFNDRHLARLGRIHTAEAAYAAFAAARDAGFDNVGIDLIHSLPDQTVEEWLIDLAETIRLGPDHVSAYALTLEEGTPFQELAEAGRLSLPAEEDAYEMFVATARVLGEAGYEQYEISNFARNGRRSLHNQVYWRRGPYLGFGAGAHSFSAFPGFGCRWRNINSIEGYLVKIGSGLLPECERSCPDRREAMGERMFLALRMLEGVDEACFAREFGITPYDAYGDELTRLLQGGMLERVASRLRLTPRGLLLYNAVVVSFL
jgi:oxygen-independent coproporphyrinogen III oxidase